MEIRQATRFLIIFFAASVLGRLLPHPPNVAPIAALALFSGAYFPQPWNMAVPVLAMLMSDTFIGFYDAKLMSVVYGSFGLTALLGVLLLRPVRFSRLLFASVGGAIFFYLTTNFAVWAFSGWYPKSLEGLLTSYIMALPFFRNSVIGNLFYAGLFFGIYEFSRQGSPRRFLNFLKFRFKVEASTI